MSCLDVFGAALGVLDRDVFSARLGKESVSVLADVTSAAVLTSSVLVVTSGLSVLTSLLFVVTSSIPLVTSYFLVVLSSQL